PSRLTFSAGKSCPSKLLTIPKDTIRIKRHVDRRQNELAFICPPVNARSASKDESLLLRCRRHCWPRPRRWPGPDGNGAGAPRSPLPPVNGKFTMTVVTTGTGSLFMKVGLYRHCLTASRAGWVSSG